MPSRPLRSAPPDRFADLAPHDLTPAETDSLIRLALAALAAAPADRRSMPATGISLHVLSR
jgi:hypothetical protein